jgi:hypothetical protein
MCSRVVVGSKKSTRKMLPSADLFLACICFVAGSKKSTREVGVMMIAMFRFVVGSKKSTHIV